MNTKMALLVTVALVNLLGVILAVDLVLMASAQEYNIEPEVGDEEDDNSNDNDSSDEEAQEKIEEDGTGCYRVGYEHGQNGGFDRQVFGDDCGSMTNAEDNRYYEGFIDGCMSVEGNTREVCESATDAG